MFPIPTNSSPPTLHPPYTWTNVDIISDLESTVVHLILPTSTLLSLLSFIPARHATAAVLQGLSYGLLIHHGRVARKKLQRLTVTERLIHHKVELACDDTRPQTQS